MTQSGRKSQNKLIAFPIRNRTSAIPAPAHFAPEERALWKQVTSEVDISTTTAAAFLTVALEAHARARLCRLKIEKEGMTIKDRHGHPRPHPLLATERGARQQVLAALRKLGCETGTSVVGPSPAPLPSRSYYDTPAALEDDDDDD